MSEQLRMTLLGAESYIESDPAYGLEASRYGRIGSGDLTAIMAELAGEVLLYRRGR